MTKKNNSSKKEKAERRKRRDELRRRAMLRATVAEDKGGRDCWLRLRPYSVGMHLQSKELGLTLFQIDSKLPMKPGPEGPELDMEADEVMSQIAAAAWLLHEDEDKVLDAIEAGPEGRPAEDGRPAVEGWKRAVRKFQNRLAVTDWKFLFKELHERIEECRAASFDLQARNDAGESGEGPPGNF